MSPPSRSWFRLLILRRHVRWCFWSAVVVMLVGLTVEMVIRATIGVCIDHRPDLLQQLDSASDKDLESMAIDAWRRDTEWTERSVGVRGFVPANWRWTPADPDAPWRKLDAADRIAAIRSKCGGYSPIPQSPVPPSTLWSRRTGDIIGSPILFLIVWTAGVLVYWLLFLVIVAGFRLLTGRYRMDRPGVVLGTPAPRAPAGAGP